MRDFDERLAVRPGWLDFEPVDVLDEYDRPLLFTLQDEAGNKYMAYFCGERPAGPRFLVVPAGDGRDVDVAAGRSDLRTALTAARTWVFDLDRAWEPVACWDLSRTPLAAGFLPAPGVMLRAWMRPVTREAILQPVAAAAEAVVCLPVLPTRIGA